MYKQVWGALPHIFTCLTQVIFIAAVAFCSRAYYAQHLNLDCDNDVETSRDGCTCNGKEEKSGHLRFKDEDVEMGNYQIPDNWDIQRVLEAITTGPGYFHLKGVFSEKDVAMARERIHFHNHADKALKAQQKKHITQDEKHNNFNGMVWALFNKGKVFEKFAQHPVILNISNIVLGENSQVSSLAANTVLPGTGGQLPHLDYPYYRMLYPSNNPSVMDSAPPLSIQFVTLLTDFTKENGGTAFRPNSHKVPRYPDDTEDFYSHAVQAEGKAGDMVLFAGALQHCAMPNRSKGYRSGILQHMAPIYLKPFEDMAGYVKDEIKARASVHMKRLLAIDHPYPMLKL